MSKIPEELFSTLSLISAKLGNEMYAVRGTAGLYVQGIDMNISDIDIVCDKKTALRTNDIFKEYLKEEVKYSETEKYKSFFGKFTINSILVEVYGDWQIKDTKGEWSRIYDATDRISTQLNGFSLYVTPITVELEMFAKMGRWSAFQKIKKQIRTDPARDPGSENSKVEETKQLNLF